VNYIGGTDDPSTIDDDEEVEPDENGELPDDKKWNVLIVEDSDEFLSTDAKGQAGQGFSRLLNLTDGMIGQGLKVIVLLTTNEEIGKLHPALMRSGRIWQAVDFPSFSRSEAKKWADARGRDDFPELDRPTLADLYHVLDKGEVQNPTQKVGFGR
jgi:hypothetical protein